MRRPVDYIRQILPYGFESFSITFWQSLHGVDPVRLAAEVTELLAGSGVIISSLSAFGNPLMDNADAAETRDTLEQAHRRRPPVRLRHGDRLHRARGRRVHR